MTFYRVYETPAPLEACSIRYAEIYLGKGRHFAHGMGSVVGRLAQMVGDGQVAIDTLNAEYGDSLFSV